MKRVIVCLTLLLPVAAPAAARTVELTLHAMKASEPAEQHTLLPNADEQTDADAAPLYEKALQSLPSDLQREAIDPWLKTPPDKLPRKEVQTVLEKLEPTLKFLKQAAHCKQCDWPYLYDDEITENLRQNRRLIFLLALKMRFQIAQGRYDEAIDTAQIGFAMARHLGEDPAQMRGLIGISIAAYMCRQLEALVQRPDAPNLYQALRDLPQPFVDLTEQAEWEDADIKEKVHLLMNRLGRHLAILQCIEAIRLYTSQSGKFPARLSDVTQALLPNDPVTRKPFVYSSAGPNAVLEMTPLKGATEKDIIRCELRLEE